MTMRTHGMTGSRERNAWHNAKVRCYYKKSKSYNAYGERGITMCNEWRNSFEQFYADMGPCPDGYTLERINVNGDYEPSNCKWVSRSAQARNKRDSLVFNGKNLIDIAHDREISYSTLRSAMKRGEDPATYTPSNRTISTMKRTNYYYPEPMLKRVRKVAKKQGIPASEYIRRAIEEALRRDNQ